MILRRKTSLIIFIIASHVAVFLFLYNQVYSSIGSASEKKTVLIQKGDNFMEAGEKLHSAGVISGKYYLGYYLWKKDLLHSLVAGVYEFSLGLNIPEVSRIITGGEVAVTRVPITFPEGWTAKQMAERISGNGFSGDDFLSIVNSPTVQLREEYKFLAELKNGQTLEGYLFPDTYYFAKDASADDIVGKMLNNFEAKMNDSLLGEIAAKKKTLREIVIMASIVEGEVSNDEDRKVVAGLFWNRLENGIAFGSDATLEYILGGNKRQHSIAETKTDSPYNTYLYKGLPPGPVSNPGMSSIIAAVHPSSTEYVYFLSDPKTGKTIFSKTFNEHIANKAKYGL